MYFKGSFSSNVVHDSVQLLLWQSWTYIFFKLQKFYLYTKNVYFDVDPIMIWINVVKTLDSCRQHTEKLSIIKGCLHELILSAKLLSLLSLNKYLCLLLDWMLSWALGIETQVPYGVFLQIAQSPGQGQLNPMPAWCETCSAGPHMGTKKAPLSWSRQHLVGVLREQTGVWQHGRCAGVPSRATCVTEADVDSAGRLMAVG